MVPFFIEKSSLFLYVATLKVSVKAEAVENEIGKGNWVEEKRPP